MKETRALMCSKRTNIAAVDELIAREQLRQLADRYAVAVDGKD